jgi:hypothetical protein
MNAVARSPVELLLRPSTRSVVPLAVVTTVAAALVGIVLFVGRVTRSPGVAAITMIAFIAMPVVVLFGTRIEVRPEAVAIRHGIGRWHRAPRSEVVRVVAGGGSLRQPRVECRSGRVLLRSLWTPDQLRRLAGCLGVDFID